MSVLWTLLALISWRPSLTPTTTYLTQDENSHTAFATIFGKNKFELTYQLFFDMLEIAFFLSVLATSL